MTDWFEIRHLAILVVDRPQGLVVVMGVASGAMQVFSGFRLRRARAA